jgi:hypothetical protein
MTERQVILERIRQFRELTNNFTQGQMRWKNREFNNVLYKDIDYDELDSIDLMNVFERIVVQYYKGY